ncbi:glutathione S-transferase family protein [Bradyrhizobium elkanii]|uniref:glutathione S-transferase family protein n=1 Tax=Bradyrhizobium elkanii TaxID=29448 RepID=UPI0020A0CED2|nr:glutathione S-transferase family protein [Bradyrhizobium elkanii]MCP1968485.1 glutathione S-transferase [Bradyrhizobium elkanii]MCS4110014.1 glutathione S-transferase [Bradyrhizobium elkanii]
MKLYDFGPAASAQRVRVFLAEKGLDLPTEQLNVREGAQYTAALTEMNPFHCVPFLELNDGTIIAESLSICRYLEELHPTPALFGRTSTERALIDMWLRRFELDGLVPMLHAVRNSLPAFAGRVVPGTRNGLPQLPELVTRGREMMEIFLGRVEPHMAKNAFVAGSEFSVADITAFFAVRSANTLKMDIEARYPAVAAWFARISARPSFQL